jgi:hypothetical protein
MRQKYAAEAEAVKAAAEEQARAAAEADAEIALRRKQQEDLQKALETTPDVATQYGSLLSMLQSEAHATSVYLGRKEITAEETVQLQYIAATSNNKFMVGKTLASPPADDEEVAEGSGITFDVWTPIEEEDAEVCISFACLIWLA